MLTKTEVKQIPIRIRRCYYDAIVEGEKTIEYRKNSDHWLKMLSEPHSGRQRVAVFVCGKRVHRRLITEVRQMRTPNNFSNQGKKDVPTPSCFAIHLGREIRWCQCVCGCVRAVNDLREDRCDYCNDDCDYNEEN